MSIGDDVFESVIRPVFENNWERRIIIGILVVLIYLIPLLPVENLPFGLTNPQVQLLAFLGVILFYLEIIETGITRLLKDPTRKLHQDNNELNNRIERITDEEARTDELSRRNISTLYAVDYSGQNADRLVENAIKNGLTVNLLLKFPQSARNSHQRSQMKSLLKKVSSQVTLMDDFEADRLNIKYYWYDGVVRGRRLDDQHVFMGWYIRTMPPEKDAEEEKEDSDQVPDFVRYVWENNKSDGEDAIAPMDWEFPKNIEEPPLLKDNGDAQKIWGHSRPHIEFTREDEEFDELDKVFSEDLFNPLWEDGISPHELYELERALKAHSEQSGVDEDAIYPEGSNFMLSLIENEDSNLTESFLENISPTHNEAALIER